MGAGPLRLLADDRVPAALSVRAVSFTAYDPSHDDDGRFAGSATDLIVAVLTALGSSSRS